MEPETCMEVPEHMSEKLWAKFPATTWGYPMENSPFRCFWTKRKPSRRSITVAKRYKKEKKERWKKWKKTEPKDVGHILIQNFKSLISAYAQA